MKLFVPRSLEKIFVLLALLAYSNSFVRLFVARSEGVAVVNENNVFMQAFFAATYLGAGLYLFFKPNRFFLSIKKMTVVWLLVLWASLSFFWSYAPDITLRRSIALIGTTLFAVYLATRFSPIQNFRFLGITFCIVLSASFIFSFLSPTELGWTGVFLTKNELTRTSLLAGMVFVYLLLKTRERIWGILILASLVLIYKSYSATGIILSIIF